MQLSNVLLLDAAAGTETFKPMVKDGTLCTFRNVLADVSLSQSLTLGMRAATKKNTNRKVTVQVAVPYISTSLAGIDTYKHVDAYVDYVIPSDAPASAIDALVAYVGSVGSVDIVNDTIVNGAFPY
jgi:hypothetical protein